MKNKRSNFAFKMMVNVGMPIRNLFMPPKKMLAEVEIKPGDHVLDFGCGPGAFTLIAAEKTGPSGMVYALDIHPLAVKMVEQQARKNYHTNIQTILSSCQTCLADNSLDLLLFFDVFHILNNQTEVLVELHRVLKPDGILCFSDHHLKDAQIVAKLTERRLFKLEEKGRWTFSFRKA